MDVSTTIAPKSDQLNAEDLIGGPELYTVEAVSPGSTEQPVNVRLAEIPGRAYRPSKTMRRVLVNAWGKDSKAWVGRKLVLFRDPDVKFGGEAVGGIKVSHLSHIDGPVSLAVTVTRGKRAPYTVEPLPDSAPTATVEPTADDVAGCDDIDRLRDMYRASATNPERQAQITERVAELSTDKDN